MTQGKHPDRYVIRELTGYAIGPAARANNSRSPTTDVYVFDSWDGFGIVAAYKARQGSAPLEERRKRAYAQCGALNEEHRRWLHGARWASKVPEMQAAGTGEDAQARKGTAS